MEDERSSVDPEVEFWFVGSGVFTRVEIISQIECAAFRETWPCSFAHNCWARNGERGLELVIKFLDGLWPEST